MATSTTHYVLQKPTIGGDADLWGDHLNTNMDIVDQEIFASRVLTDTPVAASTTNVPFDVNPSVNHIRVMLSAVSSNGTSDWLVQFSAGAGYLVTDYVGSASIITGTNACSLHAETGGFPIMPGSILAANTVTGVLDLSLANDSGLWLATGIFSRSDGIMSHVSGTMYLAGNADGIRLVTENGTDTFDSGAVNIQYEYGIDPTYGV